MKNAFRALMGAAIGLSAAAALAQAWPAKPVTWIVPFSPGGPADVIARVVALKLAEPLGQPVIIFNRGGGTTNIGHDMAARAAPLPEVPVIAETLPGFVLVGWHGVMLPTGVPRSIVERLNSAFGVALADPEVTKRITDGYSEIAHTSPEAFGEILREDFAKYARIVRDAGIKVE